MILDASTEKPTHLPGIDVSNWQGEIDWAQVKAAGMQFAFIKATEGTDFQDRFYLKNINGARQHGIACGAYHFFRPDKPVPDQAANFLSLLSKMLPGDLPPVLDVESPEKWSALTIGQRVGAIMQWMETVQDKLGCAPMLYMSSSFAGDVLAAAAELSRYKLWVAHYTDKPAPWVPQPFKSWTFWQYTNQARIDGIAGDVDRDWFNGNSDELESLRIPG